MKTHVPTWYSHKVGKYVAQRATHIAHYSHIQSLLNNKIYVSVSVTNKLMTYPQPQLNRFLCVHWKSIQQPHKYRPQSFQNTSPCYSKNRHRSHPTQSPPSSSAVPQSIQGRWADHPEYQILYIREMNRQLHKQWYGEAAHERDECPVCQSSGE